MTDAVDQFDALFEQVAAEREAGLARAGVQGSAHETTGAHPESAAGSAVAALSGSTGALPAEASAAGEAGMMYERLGGIVRTLHDSLRELGYDKALTEASTQMVDAQDRLEYVATLTEQAANKVLNTLDEGMPAQDQLSQAARSMEERWADLYAGKLSVDQFKVLAGDSRAFATSVQQACEAEKARLLAIMMAQDFQDITGQLIKKVVSITKVVENELAELLRDSAPPAVRERLLAREQESIMTGPSVPTVALSQDSVDDLLADLGF